MVLKATVQKQSSKHLRFIVSLKSLAELWTVISNQMVKYQLSYSQFDQISNHKQEILVWKPIH